MVAQWIKDACRPMTEEEFEAAIKKMEENFKYTKAYIKACREGTPKPVRKDN